MVVIMCSVSGLISMHLTPERPIQQEAARPKRNGGFALRLAAALCILLSSSLVGAQGAVKAGEDLPVQVDVALPLVEPYLAIHPKDPAILVAAAMTGHPDGTYGALVFSSRDGG